MQEDPQAFLLIAPTTRILFSLLPLPPLFPGTPVRIKRSLSPEPVCKSHHHLLPIEQRPGEGGEGYIESVTACARKMAVGIKLYCWLILVHLFYNNKNKFISHKLWFCVCSVKSQCNPPIQLIFHHWMLLALLSTGFINNCLFPSCSLTFIINSLLFLVVLGTSSPGNLKVSTPKISNIWKEPCFCLYILKFCKCSELLDILWWIMYHSICGYSTVSTLYLDSDIILSFTFQLNSCSQHFQLGICPVVLAVVLLSNLGQSLRLVYYWFWSLSQGMYI